MSQYIVQDKDVKYVFGWDQPLMTFFLQVHDLTKPEDEQLVYWRGGGYIVLYEVEDLVQEASAKGLELTHDLQVQLYADKDGGL